MGAYLLFKIQNTKEAQEIGSFLDVQSENKKLAKFHRALWVWDERDREIELKKVKEKGYGAPDAYKIGEGAWKASGLGGEEEIELECFKLVTSLFWKLHKRYKVLVYSGSCALSGDYFSPTQIKIITKNGTVLTGDRKTEIEKLIEK